MRKIIHIDMDAFFAAVEQRDNPSLKGKPVVVGGNPDSRGVVCTASYEARKYGIHSAMPTSTAYKRCPHAIFVFPRFEAYLAVSTIIREIFHSYTDLVEPLSLDEAFLDVTSNKKGMASATLIAEEIRAAIQERTQLTASAGVSFNKFIAKIASDQDKPNGITVIPPDQAASFIAGLSIRSFFGVGKVTEKKMLGLGVQTGADLKAMDLKTLVDHFGKSGKYYYDIARGRDERPVEPNRERKSIGKETTFSEDIDDREEMEDVIRKLASDVARLMGKKGKKGRTVCLKVKYADFRSVTRRKTFLTPLSDAKSVIHSVLPLLEKTEVGENKVRLLGVSVSNFDSKKEPSHEYVQTEFAFMKQM